MDGSPVACSLCSSRQLTASIKVTKAREILVRLAIATQSKEMPRLHEARWFTLRHDFIDWFGSVIEPSTIVTNRSQLSIALGVTPCKTSSANNPCPEIRRDQADQWAEHREADCDGRN